ncbi:MFS transporter [Streptomyces sp. NBC_01304]|uniref:MFS transporter n=1 Tax=Streptomyces sp. NBC_01304 TaxID=2903818 RepID=UPI002E166A90|nr:MFS transporter [Streptomyces sp. NBC_01304]
MTPHAGSQPSTSRPVAGQPAAPRARNAALALLTMAQFLVVIDASVINVALPPIAKSLHFTESSLSWVVNAYTLALGGLLLLGGRLADRLGRRRMFMAGLALFGVASLLGGLAPTAGWLIAGRALQGVGAALVSPAALSLLTVTFTEGKERNRALGIWGAATGAGGAAGVLLGGVITSGIGWRWVLFVNVPVSLVVALLALRLLAESAERGTAQGFGVTSAVTVTAGLCLVVYAAVDAESAGWGSAATLGGFAGGAVLIAAFLVLQARSRSPLMPLSIFRLPTLRGANVVALLLNLGLLAMFFFLSLYMGEVLHYDAMAIGVAYLPLTVSILVAANAAGRLAGSLGLRTTLVGGLACLFLGLAWFTRISAPGGSYAADLLGPCLLAGIGFGGAVVPLTIAAVHGAPAKDSGLASGLFNTTQQIGGALGLGILASVAATTTSRAGASSRAEALTEGFRAAFGVAAACVLLGIVAAFVLMAGRGDPLARHGEEAGAGAPAEAAPAHPAR